MPSSTTANEALGRLDPERRRWIEEFRDSVRALLGERLRDIRLFGSEARGEGGEGSDIDILVLVDGFDLDTWKSVHDMAYSISPWLSPLTEDYERYHAPRSRATGIYKAMRKESIRL
jgi:predicted nucleotidyltransferase